ncbi:protein of unknown function [Reichenbachiella faecimaris]|uniref:DUF349 domain-containing protein n=1 Tax=Reichenbachiella faecimaris TaxID=692418 RepID=A0A1W2GQN4_REIFA|nr:DUF349 domain-containing protein [Reichenbachiella faecimaris]SMD38973.1 protein of unknown function [Reichenbachiella faecimaris]
MINENEMTGSTDDKSKNPGAVQENPELTNENDNTTNSTSDSTESEVPQEITTETEGLQTNEEPSEEVAVEQAPIAETPQKELPKVQETSPVVETSAEEAQEATPDSKDTTEATPQKEESITEETAPTVEADAEKSSDSEPKDANKDEDEEEVEEEIDYTAFSKEELTTALADLSNQEDGFKKGKKISHIKKAYDVIFQGERSEALEKFEAEGGSKDDFQYKLDEFSIKFEAYHKILREKKSKNAKEQEKQKEKNLELKNALLERLRIFVDDDENTSSINALKKMQEEWKAIGPVHHQHNRTLWANYNALMDRYYDHRSIYFELKELDRKKNLEAKLDLCKQAEALDALENLNEAIKRLNELHEEYKHIGPIPKEVQEETWQRFKAASDLVYAKRKDYVSHLKEELGENYEKKIKVAEKISEYAKFTSDNIGEWNTKTKELLAIQKEWEAIGAMPKDQAKAVNKKFWGDFKSFFHNKSAFFKTLDSQREENLKKKQELVDKAISLQANEDWEETANTYKALQREWKEVGPVPGKEREKIYKKFKAACDEFFNKKRGHNKEMESSYDDNLKKKEDICSSLEALAGAEDLHPEQVYELQDAFNAIGFVPKKTIKAIQNRYQEALNKIIAQAKDFDEEELTELKSLVRINKIKSGPHGDHKLQRKEHSIKRKIQTLEKDVSTWKNNLSFFANSKTANEMLKDFEEKIKKAEAELEELKEELKLITYAEH